MHIDPVFVPFRRRSSIHARLASSLAIAAVVAGCMTDEEASPPEPVESGVTSASTNVTYDLDEGGGIQSTTWHSGSNNNLSGYVGVNCVTSAGAERLVVKLTAFREPSGNADNFIARLRAVCRRYEAGGSLPYTVYYPYTDNSFLLYTDDYRDPGLGTEVVIGGNGDDVPVGVRLKVNSGEYVKDVQLLYRKANWGGLTTLQDTPWATGLSGTEVTLECNSGYALTGIKVDHSTNTGKIRKFRIECHRLVH